jgi:hypothetical protein
MKLFPFFKRKANTSRSKVRKYRSPNILESKDIKIFAPKVSTESTTKEPTKKFKLPIIDTKNLLKSFNKIIAYSIIGSLVLGIIYLLLIDQTFLVKNLNLEFKKGSYLSRNDSTAFKKEFESAYFSIFAKNSIWFASSAFVTSIAKEINPTIESVEIKNRILPNTLDLIVTTTPILATVEFNNNEKWRVSKNGQLVTQDDININEKLVVINNPVIWNSELYKLSQLNLNNVEGQLDKLYFINFTSSNLKQLNYNITRAEVENLESDYVTLIIDNSTKLKFDYKKFTIENSSNRLNNIFGNSKINRQVMEDRIDYIDFRVSENVFVCFKGTKCNN